MMLQLFGQSLARYAQVCLRSLWPPGDSPARRSLRRYLVLLLFLPAFGVVQLAHWLGFLLDEVFYRGYRDVAVREPVFVTGVPRSGTTLVHRTLASDDQFTTFSTWECLFAPSISERRLVRLVNHIDRRIGRPLGRLLRWTEQKVLGSLDEVHGTSLAEAEEDYFVFMPLLCCFILVVPFPDAPWLWQMGKFDIELDAEQRSRVMRFYRSCVQRHLYAHGPDKRFLSKNASFAPLLGSLADEFPDARFVCCLRDPVEVVASQLSALRGGMEFFCNDPYDVKFRDKLIDLLDFYYRNLADAPIREEQREWVTMKQFQDELAASVQAIYTSLDIELTDEFRRKLASLDAPAREYRSSHCYRLEDFGLDGAELRQRFEASTAGLDYDVTPLVLVAR